MKKVLLGLLLIGTLAQASDVKVQPLPKAQREANFKALKGKWKKERAADVKKREEIENYVEEMVDNNDVDEL